MANSALQLVDFISSDGKPTSGLVPIRNAGKSDLSIDEKASVFYAETFKHIDYVFFRRFSDGRSSQISAYIVDNSDERLDETALAELHLNVWLHGTAPLLYIAWPSRIDILTCARGPDFWDKDNEACQYTPTEKFETQALKTASKITNELKRFSALRLAEGTFWEAPCNRGLADYDKTAHQMLIQAVVETDQALEGETKPVLRRLLLLTVLIKYLEDRGVFPNDFFGKFHRGATNFPEVLKGGDPHEVGKLLGFLENKFNGDVFSLPTVGQQALSRNILIHFANLVEARTLNKQYYLWKQFSFKHLPVEIISNLYQRFVQGGHGAVYTPPFLVSLLLDYAMPYEKLTGQERVLDPACGSGIFLVGAFKRLINVWRSQNDWQRPDVKTLKRILKQSICGIELDNNAVGLTAFSMCLAICDALQPDVIWKDLKFDILRETNLLEKDFFSVLRDFNQGKPTIFQKRFDVIVGNPPFESKLSEDGKKVNQAAQRQDSKRGVLPDNQLAYLFLEQAFNILRSGGQVCLIQPFGLLYNRYAQDFRTAIFRKYKVDTVFDFISIRNLYEAADTKTVAVLAHAGKPSEDHWIKHWTFRRTVSVHERICFELDHYDRNRVSQKQAETDFCVWRVNLLGGGRMLDMSHRLRHMRTLAEYIEQKQWDYGEGFIVASAGKRTPAPFLTGSPLLPTDAFTDTGIDKSRIDIVRETQFRSAYTKDRFSSPLVLIKKLASLPIEFWDEGFIAYRHRIVGIHAPHTQISELRKFYNTISHNHDIYRFLCTLNGMSLVGTATALLKQDIDELPYPEDLSELSFSFWEKALYEDTLKYMTDYIRLGQNSKLLTRAANIDDLRTYSDMFIRMLSSVYDNLQASVPISHDGLTCQPFYFGKHPDSSLLTEQKDLDLRTLIYDEETHESLRTIRVLRFYSDNCLLLIKPDRLRYWIRSTAIRDADETIVDLRRQGY